MRDIARRLGLDASTVSLALRANPRIPSATRDRVRRVAEELGYEPDPMLAALASYRRHSHEATITAEVAWVNCWTPPERFHAYREFDGYWRGALAAAREVGYRLQEFNLGDAPLSRLCRQVAARGTIALLVPPHPHGRTDWDELRSTRLPVVRIGHSVPLEAHAVGCDQTDGAILAFRSMHARGYRRIGFVTHQRAESSSRFRAGFLFAQGSTPDIDWLPTLTLREECRSSDLAALVAWGELWKPDAILTSTAEVRGLLAEAGVRVPEDVGLAATSVLDGNADAGIDQRPEEIGRAAVELVAAQIARGARELPAIPRMTMVRACWRDGASLPVRAMQSTE